MIMKERRKNARMDEEGGEENKSVNEDEREEGESFECWLKVSLRVSHCVKQKLKTPNANTNTLRRLPHVPK